MAGSLNHIVDDDGTFTMDCIDNLGDAHEALDECYRLIYVLAGKSTGRVSEACKELGLVDPWGGDLDDEKKQPMFCNLHGLREEPKQPWDKLRDKLDEVPISAKLLSRVAELLHTATEGGLVNVSMSEEHDIAVMMKIITIAAYASEAEYKDYRC